MLPQFDNGLLELGDTVVKCLGNNHVERRGFWVSRNWRKVRWASGNCRASGIVRLLCLDNRDGQFSARLQPTQPRSAVCVRSSQRNAVNGEEEQESLLVKSSVHFVGIGGAGLSALAYLALEQGWEVSGSDAAANDRMKELKDAGATIYVGHAPIQVMNRQGLDLPDAIVVSSAIPSNNEEVRAAEKVGLPIYKRADWLGKITKGYEVLAVAGSHGKSTTAAMLATVLQKLGDDVTAVVGAEVPQFPGGRNAIYGKGRRFVLEADEYDGCFLGVTPALAVVTNIEWEHVDMFPDEASVRDLFEKFVRRIRPGGTLVASGDSSGSKLLASIFQKEEELVTSIARKKVPSIGQRRLLQVITFGLDKGNDWQAVMLTPNIQGGTDYVAVFAGRPMARVSLQVPGVHNVLNSLAALVTVSLLASQTKVGGSPEDRLVAMKGVAEAASRVLAQFEGVRRRFEFVGSVKRCVIYDDYAHHPTEVRAVLQAARQKFDRLSLWVVFQPHTYSRLARLLNDFAVAFDDADRVIITEVYSAREENVWNISGEDLAASITGPPAVFIPNLEDVVERLTWELTVNETMETWSQDRVVLLLLGAGDITNVGTELLKAFQTAPS